MPQDWSKNMNKQKLAVAAKVHGDVHADILRGLLEAQEIPVMVAREGAARALGVTVGSLGEIEILVPEEHLAEARQIIVEYSEKINRDEN
jgi:hypothetical protein